MTNEKNKAIKFSLFSDLHYLKGDYINTLTDLQGILDRASGAGVDFVMQAGDFCQNRVESPELDDVYLHNAHGLTVYGIYGNHDMEHHSDGANNMKLITPLLTNDPDVTWGTEDGRPSADGGIGYYYFEKNGFRVVCLDSNYSWNPTEGFWEHNRPASWGAPTGNQAVNSLGPVQLAWLERVLTDAAEKSLSCIVVSHEGFSTLGNNSPDSEAVREMFRKVNGMRRGTVLMAINGHWHTHNIKIEDNVFYLQMNSTRCADERYNNRNRPQHYPESAVYDMFDGYAEDGSIRFRKDKVVSAARSSSTWYWRDALNGIITVTGDGSITMEGMETDWLEGVKPNTVTVYHNPYILSGEWKLDI
ncbi:MAG: metallophosphoesterase family protein [Clostridia bacterium]|nr:metallophosphoesterase family protein [Clostridia bacterium]